HHKGAVGQGADCAGGEVHGEIREVEMEDFAARITVKAADRRLADRLKLNFVVSVCELTSLDECRHRSIIVAAGSQGRKVALPTGQAVVIDHPEDMPLPVLGTLESSVAKAARGIGYDVQKRKSP